MLLGTYVELVIHQSKVTVIVRARQLRACLKQWLKLSIAAQIAKS